MAPQAPDAKSYYGYLFKQDKSSTEMLSALLRAIANHIITEIGDKNEKNLTPTKLAAFYRAAGGDYDRLFLTMPDILSFIWCKIGCEHSLQPTGDDYKPPSIPALTLRGFVRWETVEILLDPAVHVPFIQFAVQNWALKHPDTGQPFPSPLPADAFPTEPDAKMVKWHEDNLQSIKGQEREEEDAKEKAEDKTPRPSSPRETRRSRRSPRPSPRGSPRTSPSRAGPTRASDTSSEESLRGRRPERGRGATGVGSGVHYFHPTQPGIRRPADSFFPTVQEEEVRRRRSVSGNHSPKDTRRSPELPRQQLPKAQRVPPSRAYSHPKVSHVTISSDSDSDSCSPSPKMRSRAHQFQSESALHRMPTVSSRPSVRHVGPGFASPKRGYSPNLRPPQPPPSESGERRKSFPSEGLRDKLFNTVSGMLSSNTGNGGGGGGHKTGSERPRSSSRANSHTSAGGHLRPDEYISRREEADSDDSEDDYNSSERDRRRRNEMERDREREREKVRAKPVHRARDRDWERDRERDKGWEREVVRDRIKERHSEILDERPLRPAPKRASPYRRAGPPSDTGPRDGYEGLRDGYEEPRDRDRARQERRRRDIYRD
ncbi:uncharacterized protein DNG_04796 [Cephalotrichum gorgonifer]|uniref:DUF7514 domain-containing protein n=1 Tax=Cephalotrichum gorgonifer TaxID=2041049 RepID=A0AAE8MZ57_9PEZI|nr:uncharacterized protein DNG_04796 [Cephalotrichum gorgonifer]